MPVHYFYLLIAIIAETVGTTALNASQQFTKLWPTLLMLSAYGTSLYFMSLTLKWMPVGVVYAIWSGLGIVLIATIAFVVFAQKLDFAAILGIGMIIAGVVVIHVFSDTTTH